MDNNKNSLALAVLALALSACSAPRMDGTDLKAEIDAARTGHYGQAMLHEELSEEKLAEANNVLRHIEKDHYWNIDEKAMALDAAKQAAQHRLESEKEMCLWLTEVHGNNHRFLDATHEVVAYFKTASDEPYKVRYESIGRVGRWLQTHPDARATVTASTDTVGKSDYNLALSQRRAQNVAKMLVEQGANTGQLSLKALGEAEGTDNTPNQDHRVAIVLTGQPEYMDCPAMH